MSPKTAPKLRALLARTVSLAAFALGALVTSPAWAQTESVAASANDEGDERGWLGLMATTGSFSGFGLGLELGGPTLGVRAAFGFHPMLIGFEEPGDDQRLEWYSSWLVAPDVYFAFLQTRRGASAGVQLGYRYDTLTGHGAAVGGFGGFRFSQSFAGLVTAGVLVFPDAEDRIREEEGSGLAVDADFTQPGPNINLGLSLSLLWFP